MNQLFEQRDSFRLPFTSKVICQVDTIDKKCCGTLRDISVSGFFMETDDCPRIDEKCDIEIIIKGKHSQLRIENLSGIIIRNADDGLAVRFDERLEWFSLVPLYYHKIGEQCV